MALLEADVNVSVVRQVVARIREQAVGEQLSKALDPGQQVIKIVHDELIDDPRRRDPQDHLRLPAADGRADGRSPGLGQDDQLRQAGPLVQAAGPQPLLVGADLQRPAAVEQLRTLGRQIDVPVFSEPGDPVQTAAKGLDEARRLGRDVLIVDTAGRLAIDAELMEQVRQISAAVQPNYTFLVIDAMTGQDAVGVAEAFHETLALDGVILTKLDGDARGGAALSVKEVIGRPIAFASTGEKLDDFEQFHPDRMASRILGMGDVLTLIEKAEEAYEKEQAEEAAAKLLEGQFTLDDFLEQMQQVKKMGPLGGILGMMPGMPKELKNAEIDDDELKPGRGDHPLDDAPGAGPPRAHQRRSPAAHRQRLGHDHRRGEPAGQAVQGDAEDDEEDGRAWARRRASAASGCPVDSRRPAPGLPGDELTEIPLSSPGSVIAKEYGIHMAVKLRLMRMGKKKQPTYRVVAADSRSPRDGRFIEILGHVRPAPGAVGRADRQRQGRQVAARRAPSPPTGCTSCSRSPGAWERVRRRSRRRQVTR